MGSESLWERLGRPVYVVAPMVDASELAWRMLSRQHGAQLCYSPMLHSSVFVKHPRYRKVALATCPRDRPLIVQFCGNDSSVLLAAGLLAQPYCDAIDINLGCPQAIARRGRYGAFLQDDWELLADIVSTLHKGLSVPVTCKMRVFESPAHTVRYARMLESAGCQMLTVHGRTREQKGPLTGLASWRHIKAVRESVQIPVLANGNIQCLADVERCLVETGCAGVMSAEGNLYNPALFTGTNPPVWLVAEQYLHFVQQYPCPNSYIRGHLFKLFQHCLSLPENADIRDQLAKAQGMNHFMETVSRLREKYLPLHEGTAVWTATQNSYDLVLPPWLCHAYVRLSPEEHIKNLEDKQNRNAEANLTPGEKENQDIASGKRGRESSAECPGISKKKVKKLLRRANARFHCRRNVDKCSVCPNPVGLKCAFMLCKACCRKKCYEEEWDCVGHRILTATRRQTARQREIDEATRTKEELHTGHDRLEEIKSR